jgi:hypothetical protein
MVPHQYLGKKNTNKYWAVLNRKRLFAKETLVNFTCQKDKQNQKTYDQGEKYLYDDKELTSLIHLELLETHLRRSILMR